MGKIVCWSEIGERCQAGTDAKTAGGIRNLRLLDGTTYTLRFIGNPLSYFKYFVNGRGAICADPATCPIRATYRIEPTLRYAINVLHRDEPDPKRRLKILDVPKSVLEPVSAWARVHGIDPGENDGCDFRITAKGVGAQKRYVVTALDPSPFSVDEKAYIQVNIYDLMKLYRATPESEIEERLFGLSSR